MKFTEEFYHKIDRLKEAIDKAEAVVIGAGAGLSTAAGFSYTGKRFHEFFADFEAEYGFCDMYSGGFYPYSSPEEFWAYWSRYAYLNRYQEPAPDLYRRLFDLVKNKNYFVLTTNVDHCFQKAGFDKQRLFYTQGDYGLFQCSLPCHNKTYDNEEAILRMAVEQKNRKIPSALIPRCPKCGREMKMNLRIDSSFAENEGFQNASLRYQNFILKHNNGNILFWELGVGYNTPSIIKYPFWNFTARNQKAIYACVNTEEAVCPEILKSRALLFENNIESVIEALFVAKARI